MDVWKDCQSFPGFCVNQEGILLNKKTGRLLGGCRSSKGCPVYSHRRISHYVADAWLGKRKKGFQVLHKNKNIRDNRPENLYYHQTVKHVKTSQPVKPFLKANPVSFTISFV